MVTADDGRDYQYGPDDDGNNVWTRHLGEVGTVTEKPTLYSQFKYKLNEAISEAESKASLESNKGGKGSEWLKGMTLANHFGDGTAWQKSIPKGRSIYYDPLIDNPNHQMRESWEKGRADHKALEKFMMGYMGGSLAAPVIIAGGVAAAPALAQLSSQGIGYLLLGVRFTGKHTWQALRSYHNIFGKKGGYGSIGVNYFIQSGQTGSMNPMNHNTFGYIGSAFTPSSISGQMVVGSAGGLINYTPNNEMPLRGFWNRHLGITTVEMINGGISPLYQLGGARFGFIFGTTQQVVGGRAIDYLEKTVPK